MSATRRLRWRPLPTSQFSLLTCLLLFTSCRKGMVNQQHLKPLAGENFFDDGRASRAPPAHTVARRQLRDDEQFFTGKTGNDFAANLPTPVTHELLARGRERYQIHCAVCHGDTGDGSGTIVQHGFPRPPAIFEQRLRDAPVGYLFNVITNGYGVMYPYASRVSPEDRWAIVAYTRALQLSEHPTQADADAAAWKGER